MVCRGASMAPTARLSSSISSSMRVTAGNRLTPAFRAAVTPRSFIAAARRSSVKVAAVMEVDETSFEAEADLPVLVDFWATWCGPCKLVAPSMVWAEQTFPGSLKVVKVDCTDGNKELMEKYKVYGLPCLIVFKNGVQVEGSFKEGAITKKDLIKYLEKNVGLQVPA
ncbi:putative Thioredoxin X, chloroplastic [Nannochloris sp. 'desiccata']|nr:hypothetical protein KSW81_002922 [Chlorella desiccata (nom. nud.)]KAH7624742.1 putative Thioredoxin X, chloroplastic [Chlorella desiccata (nom. nud.)]